MGAAFIAAKAAARDTGHLAWSAPLSRSAAIFLAVSIAALSTLIALALPAKDDARVLASVELVLSRGGPPAEGSSASNIVSVEPAPISASTSPAAAPSAAAVAEVQPSAASSDAAGVADLAGLADMPKELSVDHARPKPKKVRRGPSFATFSEKREDLPWDEVEPVAFRPMGPGEQVKPGSAPQEPAQAAAPTAISATDIGRWTKGKATKIKGADRTKPLYHFVIWLEPPEALQDRVAGVTYDFSSPAVQPQFQASSDQASGFKVNVAGLACAEELTVTLRFRDGRTEKTSIDGCELFNNA
ncbi:MAG: hypothetical protein AAF405_01365 [Pseudomonadota bacterium]